jgi:plasmid stabilization system protein ParE
MTIVRSQRYLRSLFHIVSYIAQDSVNAGRNFQREFDRRIDGLAHFPYRCRRSIYFDDENIRDMVYKKYTVVYEVNERENRIELIDIFNRNRPVF